MKQPGEASPDTPQARQQKLIDAESRRHLDEVAKITWLRDHEDRNHLRMPQRAGSDAKRIADENQIYISHMRLLQIQLDEEGKRFDAAMASLKKPR